jgi:hypothetical protein
MSDGYDPAKHFDLRTGSIFMIKYGWPMQVNRHSGGWRWNVDLGQIRFDDLILACTQGQPIRVYATAEEASRAAVAWAKQNER